MHPTKAKRLVVDASVVHAMGGPDADAQEADPPRSACCRDVLLAVRRVCHSVALTPSIAAEWSRHQSTHACQWRCAMDGGKKIARPDAPQSDALRETIRDTAADDEMAEAMLKDAPLIEAALAADGIVVSLDDRARGFFAAIARRIPELRRIMWVNPERLAMRQLEEWLEAGAEDNEGLRLG